MACGRELRAVLLLGLGLGAAWRAPLRARLDGTDVGHLRDALFLAAKGNGHTRPNPPVGCVITDASGAVVGRGYHPKAGHPHAEVYALREAKAAAGGGDDAELPGHTAYVTLEPCSHYGRTPPCSEALVKAGVARVVVGMVDPDDRVCGRGLDMMRDAGIEVQVLGPKEEAKESGDAEGARVSAGIHALMDPFCHRALNQQTFNSLVVAYSDSPGNAKAALGAHDVGCFSGADAVVVTYRQLEVPGIAEFLADLPSSVRRVVLMDEIQAPRPKARKRLEVGVGAARKLVEAIAPAAGYAPVGAIDGEELEPLHSVEDVTLLVAFGAPKGDADVESICELEDDDDEDEDGGGGEGSAEPKHHLECETVQVAPGGDSGTYWGGLTDALAQAGLCKAVFAVPWVEALDLVRSGELQQVELRYPKGTDDADIERIHAACEEAAAGGGGGEDAPEWVEAGGSWFEAMGADLPDGAPAMELWDLRG